MKIVKWLILIIRYIWTINIVYYPFATRVVISGTRVVLFTTRVVIFCMFGMLDSSLKLKKKWRKVLQASPVVFPDRNWGKRKHF